MPEGEISKGIIHLVTSIYALQRVEAVANTAVVLILTVFLLELDCPLLALPSPTQI